MTKDKPKTKTGKKKPSKKKFRSELYTYILSELGRHGGVWVMPPQQQISSRLGYSYGSVSLSLRRMVEAGIIEKRRNSDGEIIIAMVKKEKE